MTSCPPPSGENYAKWRTTIIGIKTQHTQTGFEPKFPAWQATTPSTTTLGHPFSPGISLTYAMGQIPVDHIQAEDLLSKGTCNRKYTNFSFKAFPSGGKEMYDMIKVPPILGTGI